jgi:hypothetical protein
MPAEDRVRREERANLAEQLAPQNLALDRQPPALIVVEENPPVQLFLQDLVLGAQVFDDLLLWRLTQPARMTKSNCQGSRQKT